MSTRCRTIRFVLQGATISALFVVGLTISTFGEHTLAAEGNQTASDPAISRSESRRRCHGAQTDRCHGSGHARRHFGRGRGAT